MPTSSQSDIDLLRVLLGLRRAKRLYRGTLTPLFEPKEKGSADYLRLFAARELVRRWLLEELRQEPHLQSPAQTREYLKLHFAGKEREVFACLFLDNRHRLIAAENLFYGTIDGASVHPREVVKRALQLNAAAVILSHNHPSSVTEPSHADELVTRRLTEALALVDIRVLDHLIVGGNATLSFAERGLL